MHDHRRMRYLEAHIGVVQKACERGATVDGYFAWSFPGNLEWRAGYSRCFGHVWVDHPLHERILKDSAYSYRDQIERSSSG